MGMGSVMGVAGQQQRSGRNPTSMGGAVLPQLDLPPEDTEGALCLSLWESGVWMGAGMKPSVCGVSLV